MSEKESMLKQAGEKLKELRTATGLSVHKVARSTNISGNYLSELERGLKEPSDVVLEALSGYYKTDCFCLYGRIAPAEATLLLDNPSFRKTIIQMSTDDRLTREERDNIAVALAKLYEDLIAEREEQ